MSAATWLFDAVLGLLLVTLALAALHVRSLYTSVMLFIAFGLAGTLTWAYLGAPDLALAEAAISAGLTGVLLIAALARIGEDSVDRLRQHALATLLPLAALALLLAALWPLAELRTVLPSLVAEQLPKTGVANPVTGVLLNFRAWDTLLEILVLLIALLGSCGLLRPGPDEAPAPWRLLTAWSRLLVPLLALFGAYLLWRGSNWPGGAFQAGAVLAACAIILRLNGQLPESHWRNPLVRVLALCGLLLFFAIAALTAWLGDGWLDYPTSLEKTAAVAIEVFATVSITVILTLLVAGSREELKP